MLIWKRSPKICSNTAIVYDFRAIHVIVIKYVIEYQLKKKNFYHHYPLLPSSNSKS